MKVRLSKLRMEKRGQVPAVQGAALRVPFRDFPAVGFVRSRKSSSLLNLSGIWRPACLAGCPTRCQSNGARALGRVAGKSMASAPGRMPGGTAGTAVLPGTANGFVFWSIFRMDARKVPRHHHRRCRLNCPILSGQYSFSYRPVISACSPLPVSWTEPADPQVLQTTCLPLLSDFGITVSVRF